MRTVDLSRAAGISSQAVRDYENKGLLPPVERMSSGFRIYTEVHFAALMAVRALIRAEYDSGLVRQIMNAAHRGDLVSVLPILDGQHAKRHERRMHVEEGLERISARLGEISAPLTDGTVSSWKIAEAAQMVGLPASTLRFWEQLELIHPTRDASSGYRMYDLRQVHRLELIALLRRVEFSFGDIRALMDEGSGAQTDAMFLILEKRRNDIFESSKKCAAATVALWNYAQLQV